MSHAHQVIYALLMLLILIGGVVVLITVVEIDFPAPPLPKRDRVTFRAKLVRRFTMFKKTAVALVSGAALASQAAVDAGVTTAMSDLKVDVGTIALAAFVVTLVLITYRKYSSAAR